MTTPRRTPQGARIVALIDIVLAAVAVFVGLAVTAVALVNAGTGTVSDLARDVQIPLIVGPVLLAFGVLVALVGRDLWQGREDGRIGAIGLAVVAAVGSYAFVQLGAIVVRGVVLEPGLTGILAGVLPGLVYGIPVLVYLTLEEVEAAFAPETAEAPETGETGGEEPGPAVGDPVPTEPVEGGRTLEPDVVTAKPLAGGVPAGATARTTCTGCATPLAVTTGERPLVVECPECGTHGRLEGAPDLPAYR